MPFRLQPPSPRVIYAVVSRHDLFDGTPMAGARAVPALAEAPMADGQPAADAVGRLWLARAAGHRLIGSRL
jgi:hypothetical protein